MGCALIGPTVQMYICLYCIVIFYFIASAAGGNSTDTSRRAVRLSVCGQDNSILWANFHERWRMDGTWR